MLWMLPYHVLADSTIEALGDRNVPDILPILGVLRGHDGLRGRNLGYVSDDLEMHGVSLRMTYINWAAVGNQNLVGAVYNGGLPLRATALVQVVKVTLRDVGLVVTAEHTHFEVGDLLVIGRSLGTRRLEIAEVLVDDIVGIDVLGDIGSCLLVGDKLLRRSEIDTVLGPC